MVQVGRFQLEWIWQEWRDWGFQNNNILFELSLGPFAIWYYKPSSQACLWDTKNKQRG